MNDYDKYLQVEAEYDFYTDICGYLLQLESAIENYHKKEGREAHLKNNMLSEVSRFVKTLDNKEEEYEQEMGRLAANLLYKQHGISLGEKIPYNHPGVDDSGFVRAEKIEILADRDDSGASTFIVRGRRFKNNGELGKRWEVAYLRFNAEEA